MIKKIFIALVALVAIFIVIVALQPAEFRVTRSTIIAAPAPAVFAQVNDFHKWDGWSPWAKLDPNMKTTHEGAPAGTGAIYSWAGNSAVGEGRMTLTESRPASSCVSSSNSRNHLRRPTPPSSASNPKPTRPWSPGVWQVKTISWPRLSA
ncbi:MAG: SRPBCC family protein [Candidatus Binatia bacterium]